MIKQPVNILILTYNRLDYFKTFVKFLYQRTRYPFHLIAIDNGSKDGTREYILELEKEGKVWKHIFNKENFPLAAAFTEGFKLVESELFISVADDMVPPPLPLDCPCWLEVFVDKMKSDETIGSINFKAARSAYSSFLRRFDR